jgi:hypothetical protein
LREGLAQVHLPEVVRVRRRAREDPEESLEKCRNIIQGVELELFAERDPGVVAILGEIANRPPGVPTSYRALAHNEPESRIEDLPWEAFPTTWAL